MSTSFLGRFCAVIALMLAACQHDPFAHTYTRQQPELADLAGEYWLTYQTLAPSMDSVLSTEASGPSGHCSLTLQPDGTFVALDFPVWSEVGVGRYGLQSFDTFTGSWTLESVGSVHSGETATPVWGLRFDADGRQTDWANLVGESAPYTIHFRFGDPDAGYALQFESRASPPQTGEPDFTIVSAFFLLIFGAIGFVALVVAIAIIGCALLAMAALAAVLGGIVLIGCALIALLALATIAVGSFLVGALIAAVLDLSRRARSLKQSARKN